MKVTKEQIESIPARDFYFGGYDSITFEAYGDDIFHIHDCPETITGKEGIKGYFLRNLDRVIKENG